MNKEFYNLFPQGSPNTVAGQYFSGASYLCPLSDMGVSVSGSKAEWLEPVDEAEYTKLK